MDDRCPRAWVDDLVGRLVEPSACPTRDNVRLSLPAGPDESEAFAKVYSPTARDGLRKRLRRSPGEREAEGLRAFARAGLCAVPCLAWGVRRRWGFWDRSFIVTQWLSAPTVEEQFMITRDWALVCDALRFLTRCHAQGLAHGDAGLRNFLVTPRELCVLDLEQWRPARRRHRLFDVALVMADVLALGGGESMAGQCLEHYGRLAGGSFSADEKDRAWRFARVSAQKRIAERVGAASGENAPVGGCTRVTLAVAGPAA